MVVFIAHRVRAGGLGSGCPSSAYGLGAADGLDGGINVLADGAGNGLRCPSCPTLVLASTPGPIPSPEPILPPCPDLLMFNKYLDIQFIG